MRKSTQTVVGWLRMVVVQGAVLACAGTAAVAQEGTLSPQPGAWQATASMSMVRNNHSATLLADGRVLVCGSEFGTVSCEIYDPALRTWSPASPMSTPRQAAAVVLLADGRVLVSGGATNTAEIYDPIRGTWSPTGPMSTWRYGATATLLRDGRVLVAGSASEGATAEIYDPALSTWSATGALNEGRYEHTATLLPDGRVLVTGGVFDNEVGTASKATVEIYDPASGTWSFAASMNAPKYLHRATLLVDGRVLVTGGAARDALEGQVFLATVEIYDPPSGTWSPAASMSLPRGGHTATLLEDGSVLAAGGWYPGAELYDAAQRTWSRMSAMSMARYRHTATLLPDGQVLVAGGNDFSAETYDRSATPAVDVSAPQWSCGEAGNNWLRFDAWTTCRAGDPESGLAYEDVDASFILATSVPVGIETTNAATNSRNVCNTQGGCTTAGPISGWYVDKKPPTIVIASPSEGATYPLNARVAASVSCADGGSGMGSSCSDLYQMVDTSSIGPKTFTALAVDRVENRSALTVTYTVVSSGAAGQTPTDISIALAAPARVSLGGTMTYAMTVTNTGTSTASSVVVSNALPAGTVFASASASQGIMTAPAVSSNGTVWASLGTVAPGGTATVSVVVTVTATIGSVLVDTATVTTVTPDTNTSNNTASRKTNVRR